MDKVGLLLGSPGLQPVEIFWLILGFTAQLLFSARFLVQWIASERAGTSIVPISFWFLSIMGGVLLLCYALWRRDPVFILGQAMGVCIYVRNLVLIWKGKTKQRAL
jgi:lipid-A-disaccharide synthase-like uncharacterized protein